MNIINRRVYILLVQVYQPIQGMSHEQLGLRINFPWILLLMYGFVIWHIDDNTKELVIMSKRVMGQVFYPQFHAVLPMNILQHSPVGGFQ